MPVQVPHLLGARALPDGSYSFEEHRPEIGKRIREGDTRLGWLGDERLMLVLNVKYREEDPLRRNLPRWEVWRTHETGDPTLAVHYVGLKIDGDQLIRQLALHDSLTHDIASEHLAARDARTDRLKREHRDENEGRADKLAWALGRDVGAPAQDGRIFATGK